MVEWPLLPPYIKWQVVQSSLSKDGPHFTLWHLPQVAASANYMILIVPQNSIKVIKMVIDGQKRKTPLPSHQQIPSRKSNKKK